MRLRVCGADADPSCVTNACAAIKATHIIITCRPRWGGRGLSREVEVAPSRRRAWASNSARRAAMQDSRIRGSMTRLAVTHTSRRCLAWCLSSPAARHLQHHALLLSIRNSKRVTDVDGLQMER